MFKMKRINFQKRDIASDNSHTRCFISGGSNNTITHAFCQILAITGIRCNWVIVPTNLPSSDSHVR